MDGPTRRVGGHPPWWGRGEEEAGSPTAHIKSFPCRNLPPRCLVAARCAVCYPPSMSTQISYATILSGATTSGAVGSPELVPVAIQIGDAITGTSITFTASAYDASHPDDPFTDYGTLYAGSTQLQYTVSADRFIALNPADWAGVRSFKIVSSGAEGADRKIAVIFQSA